MERLERVEERAFPWLCLTLLVVEPIVLVVAFWLLCVSPPETRNHVEAAFLYGESFTVCASAVAGVLALAFCVTLPRRCVSLLRRLLLRWADCYCIEVGSATATSSHR